jgi:hypothetical protein
MYRCTLSVKIGRNLKTIPVPPPVTETALPMKRVRQWASDPMGSRLFIHPPRHANKQWNGLLQFKTKNFPLISLNKMINHELEMP